MSQTDRLYGLVSGAAIKIPCITATTANITLSAAQTIDGVAVVTGDRVLVKNQTDATENGIYAVDSGDWERAKDFDGNNDVVKGTFVYVTDGTTTVGYWRVTTEDDIVIDTDDIDWEQALVNDASDISFIQSGTGTLARSVQSKERYSYSLFDFVPEGTVADCEVASVGSAGTDFSDYIIAAVAAAAGRTLRIPYTGNGRMKITKQIVLPDNFCLDIDIGVQLHYFDTAVAGDFLIFNGTTDTRSGGIFCPYLYIVLRTTTAKGVDLLNPIGCLFDYYYCEGNIPTIYNQAILEARTNKALRLRTNVATDGFWNVFNTVNFNHCHFGAEFPAGSISNGNYFGRVFLFGDRLYGDTTSKGFDIHSSPHSKIDYAYVESYGNGSGSGGFVFTTSSANDWLIGFTIFDATSGNAMVPIRIVSSGGVPSQIRFERCIYSAIANMTVVDASTAANENWIDGNPSAPGATWTATLTTGTSGTITLTAGAGGNKCYMKKTGREIEVWGILSVASVSAPVGRLFISNLPFSQEVDAADVSPVPIYVSGMEVGGITSIMGIMVQGNAQIEVTRFEAGTTPTNTAAMVKAGTAIAFRARYTQRIS